MPRVERLVAQLTRETLQGPFSEDTDAFIVCGKPEQRRYRYEVRPHHVSMVVPEIHDGEELLEVVGERKYRVEKGKFSE